MKVKHCRVCDQTGHTAFTCPKRARKPMRSAKSLRTSGEYHRKWQAAKRMWFKEHLADSYVCYLCGRRMARAETTLDHVKSRGRHPELRYEQSNLAPCCWECNGRKGSKDVEEVRKKGVTIL